MTKQGATDENGKALDGVEFSRLAESLGADVGADADLESIRFTATVLKRNFGPAAALVADAALRPTMSADDFEREKALTLDAIQQELDSPESAASRVAAAEFWGPGSVRSVPTDGTPDSVKSLTLDKVKAERARLMVPADATIVVAGDITPDEAKSALEPLFGAKPWQPVMKHPLQVAPTPTSKPAPGLRFYLVERPGAVQSVLMFVGPAVKFDSDDRIGLQAVNTALGGSFTSRLNQNLREAHGYTYGADSWVSSGRDAGSFHATTSVRADVTGDGLKEMLGELKRIASGDLSEAERNKALATLRNEQVERYGSLNAILSQAHQQLVVGQPADGPAKDLQALDNEDLAHLRSLCSKIADLDRGVLVIVGEKSKVLDQIDAAGGLGLPPPIVVDALGNPESK
jgi:predicted Zn-dependent peptidase